MGALAALAVLTARRCTGGPHSRWSPRVPRLLLLRAALAGHNLNEPWRGPVLRRRSIPAVHHAYVPFLLSPARLPAARTPPAGFCVICAMKEYTSPVRRIGNGMCEPCRERKRANVHGCLCGQIPFLFVI